MHSGIMYTGPVENISEDNIVHVTNSLVIDEIRKEKRNVIPGEKTWAETTKTGPVETTGERLITTRDRLNKTKYSAQDLSLNNIKFRHNQEGRPTDVRLTKDTRAEFTWEDSDKDANQHTGNQMD